jgi:hypothetical protein
MKPTTEPKKVTAPNAWGRDDTTMRQRFAVEEADVNKVREHYLGMNHKSYLFRHSDVGREIEGISSPGYTSWSFTN